MWAGFIAKRYGYTGTQQGHALQFTVEKNFNNATGAIKIVQFLTLQNKAHASANKKQFAAL